MENNSKPVMTYQQFRDHFTTQQEYRGGYTIFRGSATAGISSWFWKQIPPGFHVVDKWSDYKMRVVWVNRDDLSIITYCEGDIIIEHCERQTIFDIVLFNSETFYAKERGS